MHGESVRVEITAGREDRVGKGALGQKVERRKFDLADDLAAFARIHQSRRVEMPGIFRTRMDVCAGHADRIRFIDKSVVGVLMAYVGIDARGKARSLHRDMIGGNDAAGCAGGGGDVGAARGIDHTTCFNEPAAEWG